MKLFGVIAAVVLILVTPLNASSSPDEPAVPEPKMHVISRAVWNEFLRYGRDAKSLGTAPLRWDEQEWTRFAEGLGSVTVVYAADPHMMDLVENHRSSFSDDFAKTITPCGAQRALGLSALMIIAGAAAHDAQWRDAGRDSLESQLWAAGIVTPILKRAFGRARPIQDEGARSFHPFDKAYESFPSGHATNAFAFATAVAGHFDGWIVPTIVYSMATGVSLSRVYELHHFPSDVLAGALIGRAAAKGILVRHQTAHSAWIVTPEVVPRGAGVSVRLVGR